MQKSDLKLHPFCRHVLKATSKWLCFQGSESWFRKKTLTLSWVNTMLHFQEKIIFYYFVSQGTCSIQFSSVQSLSHVLLFAATWTAAPQASVSITNSWSLLKLMSTELVMSSNHVILCHPLLLPPSIIPSIRVFSNESALHIRWPKYWSFSFSISPSNDYSGLISFRMDCLYLLPVQGFSRVFSNTTVEKHQFFSDQLSL